MKILGIFLLLFSFSIIFSPAVYSSDKVFPEEILSFAYSHDNNYIAAGTVGGIINIYNSSTLDIEKTFFVHDGDFDYGSNNKIEFSPDDNYIASFSDNVIYINDIENGNTVSRITSPDRYLSSFSYRPDGQRIVSVSTIGVIRVWDVTNGEEIMKIDENMFIEIRKTSDNKELWPTLYYDIFYAGNVSYSPDGNKLIGRLYSYIIIWDADSGAEITRIECPDWHVISASFSSDGKKI